MVVTTPTAARTSLAKNTIDAPGAPQDSLSAPSSSRANPSRSHPVVAWYRSGPVVGLVGVVLVVLVASVAVLVTRSRRRRRQSLHPELSKATFVVASAAAAKVSSRSSHRHHKDDDDNNEDENGLEEISLDHADGQMDAMERAANK